MGRIFITGDTHGSPKQLLPINFPEGQNLTKDDVVIIAGDFGGIWYGDDRDNVVLDWFNNQPYTVAFADGNHENFDALYKYEVEEKWNGKVRKIKDSVYHLCRGEIFNINGKSIFAFGGAESIDKYIRKEGVSWWKEEIPTYEEISCGTNNLHRVGHKIDYIVTHDAPIKIINDLYGHNTLSRSDETELFYKFLSFIFRCIDYKQWFIGHHHIDQECNRCRLIYKDVVEIF